MVSFIPFVVLLTIAGGMHAYYMHSCEMNIAVSSKKLIYWIYAAIFLILSCLNIVMYILSQGISEKKTFPESFAYVSVIIFLSYCISYVGMKPKRK